MIALLIFVGLLLDDLLRNDLLELFLSHHFYCHVGNLLSQAIIITNCILGNYRYNWDMVIN